MHWQRCRKGSETPPQRHRTLRMEEVCPMDEGGNQTMVIIVLQLLQLDSTASGELTYLC